MKSSTKVSAIMCTDVARCAPGDDLARAARIMWERDCGCVPVTDDEGRVLAVLTDRDVAMATYTRGLAPHAIQVANAMSATCSTCPEGGSLADALRTMAQDRVRRLPVTNTQGRLVGLLSLADVLQALGRAASGARRSLMEPALGALIEVTRPRQGEDAVLVPAAPRRARKPKKAGAGSSEAKASARGKSAGRKKSAGRAKARTASTSHRTRSRD